MNERIKELAEQAGLYDEKSPDEVPEFTASFEKFAELIVRECLNIIRLDAKNFRECDIKTDLVVVEEYNKTFKYIQQHFGVSE